MEITVLDQLSGGQRRITVSVDEFRARPDEIAQQALTMEVEIVVDDNTRIYVTRRVPPLEP